MTDELAEQVAGVSALAEPARRALYLHVAAQADAVSREQAAEALALPVHKVKFHLDRLVEAGLLEVEFRRLTGRSGPGAGRPAKLYRRCDRELAVTLPERRYELAGEVLAAAVEQAMSEGVPVGEAVRAAAAAQGLDIARRHRADGREGGPDPRDAEPPDELVAVASVLARYGYEPRRVGGAVCLANCPFDRLAGRYTALVCDMNLALIRAVVEGLGLDAAHADLQPEEGWCCVRVRS